MDLSYLTFYSEDVQTPRHLSIEVVLDGITGLDREIGDIQIFIIVYQSLCNESGTGDVLNDGNALILNSMRIANYY